MNDIKTVDMDKIFQTVSKLIAEGKTGQAIDTLLSSNAPESIKNDAKRIAAAFAALRTKTLAGTLNYEEETRELARINDRLLAILEQANRHSVLTHIFSRDDYSSSGSPQKGLLMKKLMWSVFLTGGAMSGFVVTSEVIGYANINPTHFTISLIVGLVILWSKEKI